MEERDSMDDEQWRDMLMNISKLLDFVRIPMLIYAEAECNILHLHAGSYTYILLTSYVSCESCATDFLRHIHKY